MVARLLILTRPLRLLCAALLIYAAHSLSPLAAAPAGNETPAAPPATESYDALAAINRGILLAVTAPLGSNDEAAFYWYLRAANLNSPQGNDFIGNGWRDGRGIRQNDKEAVKYYNAAIQGGNIPAMKSLAEFYENGRGVMRDRDKAFALYDRAAKMGDEWSKTKAAMMGDIANITPELVAQTLRQANGGDLSSMTKMGAMQYFGVGMALNESKGNWWLEQAANHGHVRARLYLAQQALAKQDLATAARWFRRAGTPDEESDDDTGVAYAQYHYARIMAGEYGAPPGGIDLNQAVLWYVHAARADLGEAMEKLAHMLRDSPQPARFPPNIRLAFFFAVLADRHREQSAAELRALIAQSLSPESQSTIIDATKYWQLGMDFPINP